MYRDGAQLQSHSVFSSDWWISRRFFWERGQGEVPHCVVFVFDGSSDPFLDAESMEFFKTVFEDCTKLGTQWFELSLPFLRTHVDHVYTVQS